MKQPVLYAVVNLDTGEIMDDGELLLVSEHKDDNEYALERLILAGYNAANCQFVMESRL